MMRLCATARARMQPRSVATAVSAAACSAIVPRLSRHRPAPVGAATCLVGCASQPQQRRFFESTPSSPYTPPTARASAPSGSAPAGSAPAGSAPAGSAPAAPAVPAVAESTESLDFDDVSKSFAVKSGWEIARSLLVFKLCSSKLLVANARRLLDLSESILGRPLTHWALRQTFFGHFCAGETAAEVAVVIAKLEKSGLGGILDYAAEADVAAKPTVVGAADEPLVPRDRTGIKSARTYDYAGEADCDANAAICRSCIEAAGAKGDGQGFAAIKLTALGKPELLEHLSLILTQTKTLFLTFATTTKLVPAAAAAAAATTPNPNPSISRDLQITFSEFQRGLRGINVSLGEEAESALFAHMDQNQSGTIDFLEWVSFLDPKLLGGLTPSLRISKSTGITRLSQSELEKVHAMIARLESLASLAARHRVHLMIDAEQSYFQPAIDHLVLDLQRKYNTPGQTPVIFNTYQCYLLDCLPRVLLDLERSKREGFTFAAKIVRGAYMVQERRRAKEMGYADPIQPTIQHTHDNYDHTVSTLLRNPSPTHILVATHNESTVRNVAALMSELRIPRRGGGVFFGQLLGMCDHVSFSLGRCGYDHCIGDKQSRTRGPYAVYKYVPYGPIHDVLPYLIRRAEENSDLLGGATKERKLLWQELKRRWLGKN